MKIYENDEIYVRPLLESDIEKENYQQWFYDQEVCKYNSHGKMSHGFDPLDITELDPKSNIIWAVISKYKRIPYDDAYRIVNEGVHIGNVVLHIDWINRNAEFTCIFGEKEYWGNGYCTQVLEWMLDHAIDKLNLYKVWLGTAKSNIGMNKAAEKAGLIFEATLKQELFIDGGHVDINRWSFRKGH